MDKQRKPKVLRSAFPKEWNPDNPANFNAHRQHIRFLLHSGEDPYKLAKVNIARSFERLKQSIHPSND